MHVLRTFSAVSFAFAFAAGGPAFAAPDQGKVAPKSLPERVEDLEAQVQALTATLEAQAGAIAVLSSENKAFTVEIAGHGVKLQAQKEQAEADAARISALEKLTEKMHRVDIQGVDTILLTQTNLQLVNYDLPTYLQIVETGWPAPPVADGHANLIVGCNLRDEWNQGRTFGSHNLVVGDYNRYEGFEGIVAGYWNGIAGDGSVAIGGRWNTATGNYSSAVGGRWNEASAKYASNFGGDKASVDGVCASNLGGYWNIADGQDATTLGGFWNQASGLRSVAAGGNTNVVTGAYSVNVGGLKNHMDGICGVGLGGENNFGTGLHPAYLNAWKTTVSGEFTTAVATSGLTLETAYDVAIGGLLDLIDPKGLRRLFYFDGATVSLATGDGTRDLSGTGLVVKDPEKTTDDPATEAGKVGTY